MYKSAKAGLFLWVWALVWAAPAHALTSVPRSFDELVALADVVLIGTVTEVRAAWGEPPHDQRIYTYITLTELETLKGEVSAPAYTLRLSGGALDGRAQMYPGAPVLRPGKRYVVFVRGNQREFFPFVGVAQGVFRVVRDPGRQRAVVVNAEGYAVEAIQGARVLAGTRRYVVGGAMTLEDFKAAVRARLADGAGVLP